jgi:hypothetical protein
MNKIILVVGNDKYKVLGEPSFQIYGNASGGMKRCSDVNLQIEDQDTKTLLEWAVVPHESKKEVKIEWYDINDEDKIDRTLTLEDVYLVSYVFNFGYSSPSTLGLSLTAGKVTLYSGEVLDHKWAKA